MLTEDEIQAGMGAAADQIKAMLRDHEESNHGGEVCVGTRVMTAAWLAHHIGLRATDLGAMVGFQIELLGFERACSGRKHKDHE